MGSQTFPINTANQLISQTDNSKIFLGDNNTFTGTYTNGTGSDVTLTSGMVIGRISATQALAILASGSADGSQFPVGILMLEADVTVSDGESKTLTLVNSGKVNEGLLDFNGTDTLATVVSSRSLRDRIIADTEGIKLVTVAQNSRQDNA